MRIGFFGGSFNPPTNGHMNLARKAIKMCNLDKLIFVPMGDFYEKKDLAKAKDRLSMLKLAILSDSESNLEVSDLEIKEARKMSAIEAFRLIEENYPTEEKFFIMGADNFINILNWKESEELLNKYKYIVFERKDIDIKKFIEEDLKKYKTQITIVKNIEHKNTSSSKFREENKKNNMQDIVPKEVFDYIIKNDIY